MINQAIELHDALGNVVDWPAGMTAELRVKAGGFTAAYQGAVNGPYLRFMISGANTLLWPRHACAAIWLQFADQPGPVVWVEGPIDGGCC